MAAAQRVGIMRNLLTAIRIAARPGSASLLTRLRSLPRLLRATVRGEYAGTSLLRLGAIALAAVYVLSPVDLVPEAVLPLIGFVDDAVVLGWLATAVVTETEQFLAWEDGRPAAGTPATVTGSVID